MHRLENPVRLAELAPPETLKRLGLQDGMTFADIGAGTGIFTTAAAEATRAVVYAVDPNLEMRSILETKKGDRKLNQIVILRDVAEVPAGVVDLALLCTVLHEIDGQKAFLASVAACLKPEGRLAIIEFFKNQSPFGPPPSIRLSEDDTARLAADAGLKETSRFTLGENMYCITFSKE